MVVEPRRGFDRLKQGSNDDSTYRQPLWSVMSTKTFLILMIQGGVAPLYASNSWLVWAGLFGSIPWNAFAFLVTASSQLNQTNRICESRSCGSRSFLVRVCVLYSSVNSVCGVY